MYKVTFLTLACAGMLTVMLPRARADEWNQKTIFTFKQPVEIPGKVLTPGTYVFKLLDTQADRNVIEVTNKREDHLYGIFLAVPNYRLRTRGKSILTFEERAAGAPQAIKAWFYPGDNYGHEFVYGRKRAMALAKASNQPVPSMPDETNSNSSNATESTANNTQTEVQAMRQVPLKAQNPSGNESEVAEAFPAQPSNAQDQTAAQNQANAQSQTTQSTNPSSTSESANRSKNLPATASNWPLIGLLGLLSLCGAGLLQGAAVMLKQQGR